MAVFDDELRDELDTENCRLKEELKEEKIRWYKLKEWTDDRWITQEAKETKLKAEFRRGWNSYHNWLIMKIVELEREEELWNSNSSEDS